MKIYSIEIASILWIQILCNNEVAWFSTAHHSLKIHLLYKMLKNVVTPFNALLFTPLKLKLVNYFLQRFSFLKNCDFSQSTYFCSKCVIIRAICTLISDTRNLWPLCLLLTLTCLSFDGRVAKIPSFAYIASKNMKTQTISRCIWDIFLWMCRLSGIPVLSRGPKHSRTCYFWLRLMYGCEIYPYLLLLLACKLPEKAIFDKII